MKARVLASPLESSTRISGLLLALVVMLALGCAGRAHIVRDDLPPSELDRLVDSDSARDLLVDVLAQRSTDDTERPAVREQARLRDLSEEVSLDFAALSFARAVSADGLSRPVQASYHRFLHDDTAELERMLRRPGTFP